MPKILTVEELARLKGSSPKTAEEIRARNLAFAEHELALLLEQQSTIARKIATVEAVIRSQKGAVEPGMGTGSEEKVVAASSDLPPIVMPEAFGTPAFVKRFWDEAIQIVSEAKGPLSIAEVMAKHPHRELFVGEIGMLYSQQLILQCIHSGKIDINPDGRLVSGRNPRETPVSAATAKRRLNKQIVDEAIQIILKAGRPMTAAEIVVHHSRRDEVATETLYRALYERVIKESMWSFAGEFWPVSAPVPDGYDLSRQRVVRRSQPRAASVAPSQGGRFGSLG